MNVRPAILFQCGSFLLLLLLFLAGCGPSNDPTQEAAGGGITPDQVAENFFGDFHRALQDPSISTSEGRRVWAERLSSYFTPVERANVRTNLRRTLADFTASQSQLEDGQRLIFELVFANVEIVERNGDRAMIRLVDGKLRIRRERTAADGTPELVSERERPIAEVLGLKDGLFPVVQVNRRWYMTEG